MTNNRIYRSRCEVTFVDPDGDPQHGIWLSTTPHEKGNAIAGALSEVLKEHFDRLGCEILVIELVTLLDAEADLAPMPKLELTLVDSEPPYGRGS
jgi:hypothetical protein